MGNQIKTSQNSIAELGLANSINYNIELLGTEKLAEISNVAKSGIENNLIDLKTSKFADNYTEDESFFYIVQKWSISKSLPLFSEVGVGKLISKGLELHRIRPLYTINDQGRSMPISNGPTEFLTDDEDTFLLVKNYIPTNLGELLIQNHSVIASGPVDYMPMAVGVETNSILGRLDGNMQSIKLDSVKEMALDYIQSHTKQLILKSSQINAKKIKVKNILLEAHDSPDAKRGTFYYNNTVDALQFFDGKIWRTIQWRDDI